MRPVQERNTIKSGAERLYKLTLSALRSSRGVVHQDASFTPNRFCPRSARPAPLGLRNTPPSEELHSAVYFFVRRTMVVGGFRMDDCRSNPDGSRQNRIHRQSLPQLLWDEDLAIHVPFIQRAGAN